MDDEWSDEDLVRAWGWLRLLVGALLALFPRLSTKMWTGEEALDASTEMAVRGMGVRDVAIGVGIVGALESGGSVGPWLKAGAIVDAGDAYATLTSWRGLGRPRGMFWFLIEVGSALFALELANRYE